MVAPTSCEEARRHLAWIIGRGEDQACYDLADRLIVRFGSLGSVLAARAGIVSEAGGDATAAAIASFNRAVCHVLQARAADGPLLSRSSEVAEYLRFRIGHHASECLRVLHLDAKHRLLRDELVAEGTATVVVASIAQLIGSAVEKGAASLILVHNHPSGDPTPSAADVEMTARVVAAAGASGIQVIDHLVVAIGRVFSMRAAGMMP